MIKCVICGAANPKMFTAEARYKKGTEKEILCASCKMVDESIRRQRGARQYTE